MKLSSSGDAYFFYSDQKNNKTSVEDEPFEIIEMDSVQTKPFLIEPALNNSLDSANKKSNPNSPYKQQSMEECKLFIIN